MSVIHIQKKLTVILTVMTIFAIVAGLIALGLLGVSLHYHPKTKAVSALLFVSVICGTLLPLILLWTLKYIRVTWVKNVFLGLLYPYGVSLFLYMGYHVVTDGDFVIWLAPCLYGFSIIFSAYFLQKFASLNN